MLSEYTKEEVLEINSVVFPDTLMPLGIKIIWAETFLYENTKDIYTNEHSHTFFEIHFVFKGSVTYSLNDNFLTLSQGEAVLLPPKFEHTYISSTSDIFKISLAFSCNLPVDTPRHFKFSKKTLDDFSFMVSVCQKKDLFSKHLAAGRALEIIWSVFSELNLEISEKPMLKEDARIAAACKFIEEHKARGVTLDEVAKECCLSKKQIGRIFKSATGVGVHEYIIKKRVEHIKKLLAENNASIKETAFLTGFESESSFVSFFKRHTGVSPGIYKNNLHK